MSERVILDHYFPCTYYVKITKKQTPGFSPLVYKSFKHTRLLLSGKNALTHVF